MSQQREINKLAREYRTKGWVITHRSKHMCWRGPNGAVLFAAATPGPCRSIANFRAQLKRSERGDFAMMTVRNDCEETKH